MEKKEVEERLKQLREELFLKQAKIKEHEAIIAAEAQAFMILTGGITELERLLQEEDKKIIDKIKGVKKE